jgi:membrane-bound metal-dependent hydrolase YbcI (DUF457 family)
VDIVTHGLASLAVARGFFPRAGKVAVLSAVVAGTIADVDWLSVYGGPASFLAGHRTSFHSIFAALFLAFVVVIVVAYLADRWGGIRIPLGALAKDETIPENPSAKRVFLFRRLFVYILGAPVCAALLHVAMDTCQSNGVMLLWPFSPVRFALDWLPSLDPWILTILIACIALPELLHLVSSEIGAKAKKPRGQTGAIIGLALVLLYVGARATLHSNVIALMESRTFHGETPRRASAFPESLSPLTWHGVVETETALNQLDVDTASPNNFDPDASFRLFKPEPSAALDAARNTAAAKRFLATAQIPKASLEKTETGYVVVLRDLRYAASEETQREIAAVIELDASNRVTSQELVWARDLHR